MTDLGSKVTQQRSFFLFFALFSCSCSFEKIRSKNKALLRKSFFTPNLIYFICSWNLNQGLWQACTKAWLHQTKKQVVQVSCLYVFVSVSIEGYLINCRWYWNTKTKKNSHSNARIINNYRLVVINISYFIYV